MKIFALYTLVFLSALWGIKGFAQEPTNLGFYGDKKVIFDPSPDERVVGHAIYFNDGAKEWRKRLDMPLAEWIIPEGMLKPDTEYVFTATAFDEIYNESVRSEALLVQVDPIPEIVDDLPPITQRVSPPITINITIKVEGE